LHMVRARTASCAVLWSTDLPLLGLPLQPRQRVQEKHSAKRTRGVSPDFISAI